MVTCFCIRWRNLLLSPKFPMPSHEGPPTSILLMRQEKHKSNNDGIETDSKPMYRYVAVATYYRVFVLLRGACCCVAACACAPEDALELGGAGAQDAGAFKTSDGLDSSDFAERSGDADGRRFCGVDVISAFTLGRATLTPTFVISSSSLQNPSGTSALLSVLWVSIKACVFSDLRRPFRERR